MAEGVHSSGNIAVQIVYAMPQGAITQSLVLPPDARVADALQLVAHDPRFQSVDLEHAALGIFGQVAARGQVLRDGDRIEIYRSLAEDPKLARRRRARGASPRQ